MDTTLSLYKINKTFYASGHTIMVFNDLSVDFYRGVSYALTGASGRGKSTMLHILAGIETPCSGKVIYRGRDIQTFSPLEKHVFLHTQIGVVFQTPLLIPELTVLENVLFKDLMSNRVRSDSIKQGLKLLDELDLGDKAQSFPHLLSGGQAQRVSLLRALYNRPSFLLADEPLAHVDKENQQSILSMLKRSQLEWGMGIILTSHTKEVIQAMDVIYTLDQNYAYVST